MESFHSIAIVGAGLSGLYAAHLLRKSHPDLVVLEAQNRIGGRVKQVHGLTPWPIEAGPEFVHGSNSVFVRVATQLGVKFEEKAWPDWWYFEGQGGLVSDENVDSEVNKVHDLLGDCEDEELPPPGKDISVEEWMRRKGCTPRQIAVADACYANDFGCSIRHLGMRETIIENRKWDSGETYLLMDRSMGFITQQLSQGLDIRTSWPVQSIEYGPGGRGALLQCSDGRAVRCRKVLVTAPLRVLQDGLISFQPPLPAPKAAAIKRVQMGNVIKMTVTFTKQFWPEGMYDVVHPGGFAPEFWMLKRPHSNPGVGHPHCVVGFVAGERADAISKMQPGAAVQAFLQQLDKVFGTSAEPKPASSSLAASHIEDWSKEKYVRAGYTYPSLGAEEGDREQLAAPVAGTLFFAGEATNTNLNPCVQGAMETSERAAKEIAAALQAETPPRSKL